MTKKTWLITLSALVLVVVAVLGGTALYAKIQNDRAPAELGLSTPDPSGATSTLTAADLAGDWTIADGSQAGYRVNEVLNGQDVTVVGRTSDVTGQVTITGTELDAAEVTVSMTTLVTDNGGRDGQFQDILSTAEFPTSSFTLTEPVDVAAVLDGVATVDAVGELTIAGVTRPVTLAMQAQTVAGGVEVSGSIPVVFADYGVDAPNLGFVKVEDHGTVEMLLTLTK